MGNWSQPYKLQNGQIMNADWIEALASSVEYLKIDRPSGAYVGSNAGETYSGATHALINSNAATFVTALSPQANYIIGVNTHVSAVAGTGYQIGINIDGTRVISYEFRTKTAFAESQQIYWTVSNREFNTSFEIAATWVAYGGATLTAPSGTVTRIWWMEL